MVHAYPRGLELCLAQNDTVVGLTLDIGQPQDKAPVMVPPAIEPLDPDLWFDQVSSLAERVNRLDGEAPDAILRKLYYLAVLAPEPTRRFVRSDLSEECLELLLETGAYAEVVFLLLNSQLGIMLKREPLTQLYEATVTLPVGGEPGRGTGDSPAKALVAAWADCFSRLGARAGGIMTADPNPRKSQSAKPRRSTAH